MTLKHSYRIFDYNQAETTRGIAALQRRLGCEGFALATMFVFTARRAPTQIVLIAWDVMARRTGAPFC